jgi:hypothetical protein
MNPQIVIAPVDPGSGSGAGTRVRNLCNYLNRLDCGFLRNVKKWCFQTFYEAINYYYVLLEVIDPEYLVNPVKVYFNLPKYVKKV